MNTKKVEKQGFSKLSPIRNRIRGLIRRSEFLPKVEILSYIRANYSPTIQSQFINWICTSYPRSSGFLPSSKIDNYSDFYYHVPLTPVPVEQELEWGASYLRNHQKLLNEYLREKELLTQCILNGKDTHTSFQLERMKSQFGKSICLLQLEIGAIHFFVGLERQKEFVKNIRDSKASTLIKYIAWHTSARNEDSFSAESFRKKYLVDRGRFEGEEALNDYLIYKIANFIRQDADTISNILRIEFQTTLIDYYETYINVLQQYVIHNIRINRTHVVDKCLSKLTGINDYRIAKLNYSFSGEPIYLNTNPDHQDNSILLFLAGGASPVIDTRSPYSFYLRSMQDIATQSEEKNLFESISGSIRSMSQMEKDSVEAQRLLEKYCLNFSQLDFGKFVFNTHTIDVGLPVCNRTNVFLNSKYICPLDVFNFNFDPTSDRIEELYEYIFAHDEIYKSLKDEPTSLTNNDNLNILKIALLYKNNALTQCLALANEIIASNPPQKFINQCIRYKVLCYIDQDLDYEAIACVADEICKHSPLLPFLPLDKLLKNKKWEYYADKCHDIKIPIVISAYVTQYDDEEHMGYLRDSWDEFLDANDCAKASELDVSKFSKNEIVYFFRNVCIPSVMDIRLALKSSKDLDNERIHICQLLNSLDSDNSTIYQNEIIDITKELLIKEGLREIDNSRIYVSTDQLKVYCKREFIEQFNRLKRLKQTSATKDPDFESALLEFTNNQKPLPERYFSLPSNEENSILISLLNNIKNEFLNNSHHGLDSFLSMRIRHGTLTGIFKSPAEKYHFYTQSDLQSTSCDLYWPTKASNLTRLTEEPFNVHQALIKFSEEHDNLINELTSEKLQIQSSDKPDGVFNIIITAPACNIVSNFFRNDYEFEEFFDDVCRIFWALLKPSLERCTHLFSEYAKQKFEENLSSLRTKLEETQLAAHSDIISCLNNLSIEMQNTLNNVSEWFILSDSSSESNFYNVDSVFDISIALIKNTNPGFTPTIRKFTNISLLFNSKSLSNLTDVFFIILENIVKHSKLTSPDVEISFNYISDQNLLEICVTNTLESSVAASENIEAIERIKQEIINNPTTNKIKTEGNSGFIKLSKYASRHVQNSLNFSFETDNRFAVTLFMDGSIQTQENVQRIVNTS